MKHAWILGSFLGAAVLTLGASDAHALRAYTPQNADACAAHASCCAPVSVSKIGIFELDGVFPDKSGQGTCSVGSKHCGSKTGSMSDCPVAGAANLVVTPVAAVLNDAHLLITMPTRKAEPLN